MIGGLGDGTLMRKLKKFFEVSEWMMDTMTSKFAQDQWVWQAKVGEKREWSCAEHFHSI
jgi:hypothetical protein